MELNFKYAIIATALAVSAAIFACGGSTPDAQPALSSPAPTQVSAAPETRVVPPTPPALARANTPTPASPRPAPTATAEPVATATVPPTVSQPTAQPTQALTDTSTPEPPQPETTPTPTPESSATAVPPTATATAVPTPTPMPIATPSPPVGMNVGNLAPDFTLPSARGEDYPLSAYRGHSNIVLVFYRAFW